MDRTHLRRASLLVAALTAAACGQDIPPGPQTEETLAVQKGEVQQVSSNKVLILDSTVTGRETSREYLAAKNFGMEVEFATPAQWATKTAEQFAEYRALILGDASCASLDAVSAAVANRFVWGPVVNGNIFIAGTAPVRNGAHGVTQQAIKFATWESGSTGLYVSLSCYYQNAAPGTPVTLLEPFGNFTIQGAGCHKDAHVVGWHQGLQPLTSEAMSNWDCSVNASFNSFPEADFAPFSIALYANAEEARGRPGGQEFVDGTFGAPYILARGAMVLGCGDGDVHHTEECDFGWESNGLMGVECSATCRLHWCGDGVVDPGEHCDDGYMMGYGDCPRSCRKGPTTPPKSPPVARCKNLELFTPADACGVAGSIDDGSSDPDGDLVECSQSVSTFGPGVSQVSLVCRDSQGQIGSCSSTVNVVDNIAPSLSCPAASPVECGSALSPSGQPHEAKDNCGVADLAHSVEGNSKALGSLIKTRWTAADGSGNTASCVSQAPVVDTRAPSIALVGAPSMKLECNVDSFANPGATATDACAGDLSLAIVKTGAVNTAAVGTYNLGYSVKDGAGLSASMSRTVQVADTKAPVLTLNGASSLALECGVSSYTEAGAKATDVCAGDLSLAIVKSGAVDTKAKGSYAVSYSVADASGNTASATRTVSVNDTLAPSIALVGAASMKLECNVDSFVNPGATATDACSGDLTGAIIKTGAVNTAAVGTYALGYSVKDGAGLSASVSRAVQVADTKAPVLTLNGASSLALECGVDSYTEAHAKATDVCDGDLTGAIVRSGAVNAKALGTYTVGYSVADASGNTASATRTVSVNDTKAPSIALVGAPVISVQKGGTFVDPGATATDACSDNLSSAIVKTGEVNTAVPGSYTLTYSVKDGAGLSASVSRTVKVEAPQSCRSVSVKPTQEIWPPNHKMWSFKLSECAAVVDPCGGPVDINAVGTITSIYSDEVEDADGNGDGKTTGDIVITGKSTFQLRAERQGKGNGRVYGVNFKVTDASGAEQTATCKFVVPHDQSGRGGIDNGAAAGYTVNAPAW